MINLVILQDIGRIAFDYGGHCCVMCLFCHSVNIFTWLTCEHPKIENTVLGYKKGSNYKFMFHVMHNFWKNFYSILSLVLFWCKRNFDPKFNHILRYITPRNEKNYRKVIFGLNTDFDLTIFRKSVLTFSILVI